MSKSHTFDSKLRLVRLRCTLNLLLAQAARVLTIVGLIAVAAVLFQQLFAVAVIHRWSVWPFAGAAVFAVLVPWALRIPTRMDASLLLDERLRLKERFSTTLSLADSDDPFALAAREESRRAIHYADPRPYFPIKPSAQWAYGLGIWAVAIVLGLFMDQQDLFGLLRAKQDQELQKRQVTEAQSLIEHASEQITSTIEPLNDPNLTEAVRKLDELPKDVKAEDMRREAIRTLGDVSDRIRQIQADKDVQTLEMMQQMLGRLRPGSDASIRELQQALAQGDFQKASSLLRKWQKRIAADSVTAQEQDELRKQLADLAKQLRELAGAKKDLARDIERLGLDGQLAQLNPEQLRQNLEEQGLNQEQIDRLMDQTAMSGAASALASSLAQAFGASAGGAISADGLSEAIEQLSRLEALQQQAMMLQASLERINEAIASLGQGMSQGLGGEGPFQPGMPSGAGPGSGSPGQGSGPVSTDDTGRTQTQTTKTPNKDVTGPAIASWYLKDEQIKGEATRGFSEVVQAGRDSAAEAISENQIPYKYQDSVKNYFTELERRGPD